MCATGEITRRENCRSSASLRFFFFFFSFLYFFIPFRPCLRVLGGEKNLRVQHVAMMRSRSYTAIQPIFDRPESENFENFENFFFF